MSEKELKKSQYIYTFSNNKCFVYMDVNVNFLLLPTFNAIRSFYDNMPYLK